MILYTGNDYKAWVWTLQDGVNFGNLGYFCCCWYFEGILGVFWCILGVFVDIFWGFLILFSTFSYFFLLFVTFWYFLVLFNNVWYFMVLYGNL